MALFKIHKGALLAPEKVAAREAGRFALHCARIVAGPDGVLVEATDGKRLLRSRYDVEVGNEPATALIPARELAKAARAAGKGKYADVIVWIEGRKVIVSGIGPRGGPQAELWAEEGSWPSTEQAVPPMRNAADAAPIGLSLELLPGLVEAVALAGGPDVPFSPGARVQFGADEPEPDDFPGARGEAANTSGQKPVRIDWGSDSGVTVLGVIMPVQTKAVAAEGQERMNRALAGAAVA